VKAAVISAGWSVLADILAKRQVDRVWARFQLIFPGVADCGPNSLVDLPTQLRVGWTEYQLSVS
jgi:hypothetical protein